ncbi:MAG: hypothetical protein QMB23_03995, partial [Candidatus Nanopelagicales bacterium]
AKEGETFAGIDVHGNTCESAEFPIVLYHLVCVNYVRAAHLLPDHKNLVSAEVLDELVLIGHDTRPD